MCKLSFIAIALICLSFNSCVVSKKKYDAVVLENTNLNQKLEHTQSENKKLEIKVGNLISDFEVMKNDLHLSNAIKSDEMSELLVKVTHLSDYNSKLKKDLDETIALYKSQKQTSQSVSTELKELKDENYDLKRDTASIKYALKLSKERFEKINGEFETFKNKYNDLSTANSTLKKEDEFTKKKLQSFEQQLIENKEKFDAISNAFIELRKELLSAKSSNKVIDPNKNANIDKIAKRLGHY